MPIYLFISSLLFLPIVVPAYFIAALFRPELFIRIKGYLKIVKLKRLVGNIIMFHGVSVGEIIAIEELVKRTKQELPDYKIVVTTGTNTGQDIANKKFKDIAELITYFPPDFGPAINYFLNKINPKKIIIAETEIWPNFSYIVNTRNIPLYIINGRISDHSFKSYKHLRFFFKMFLGKTFTNILTQSNSDKEKFLKIGANPSSCEVMGNLKFDIYPKIPTEKLNKYNNKLMVIGSTHKGEEEILLDVFKQIHKKHQNFKILLAPRHLTRLDSLEELIKKTGLNYGFFSKNDTFENNDIIILDTLGQLAKMYYFCDFAYIGGSFCKVGGHNPLEATIYNKPVISGPNTTNFKDIYKTLTTSNAGFVVKNKNELEKEILHLLENEEHYDTICQNCANVFEQNRGAVSKVIEKLK